MSVVDVAGLGEVRVIHMHHVFSTTAAIMAKFELQIAQNQFQIWTAQFACCVAARDEPLLRQVLPRLQALGLHKLASALCSSLPIRPILDIPVRPQAEVRPPARQEHCSMPAGRRRLSVSTGSERTTRSSLYEYTGQLKMDLFSSAFSSQKRSTKP